MHTTRTRKKVSKRFSEGARQLWALVQSGEWSAARLHKELGCSRTAPHKWLYGDRKPDRAISLEIERLVGIPAASWDEAPAKPFALHKAS